MNQQPDTSTLEGKIAVMKASDEGKRIQKERGDIWFGDPNPAWNWAMYNYRVDPEDLNPPTYRPWKPEEVPLGRVAKTVPIKNQNIEWRAVFIGARGNRVLVGDINITLLDLFNNYVMEDGSPCGVREGALID